MEEEWFPDEDILPYLSKKERKYWKEKAKKEYFEALGELTEYLKVTLEMMKKKLEEEK